MVRQTSILAYQNLNDISDRQKVVYEVLLRHPKSTDRELALFLGKSDPNYVRPRRRELVKKGLIRSAGKRRCTVTHELVHQWTINDEAGYSSYHHPPQPASSS